MTCWCQLGPNLDLMGWITKTICTRFSTLVEIFKVMTHHSPAHGIEHQNGRLGTARINNNGSLNADKQTSLGILDAFVLVEANALTGPPNSWIVGSGSLANVYKSLHEFQRSWSLEGSEIYLILGSSVKISMLAIGDAVLDLNRHRLVLREIL